MSSQEPLRNALAWLLTQKTISGELITQASSRYDLSPLDDAFLREYFNNSANIKLKKQQSADLDSN